MKALEVFATLVGKLKGNEDHSATWIIVDGDAGAVASAPPPKKPTALTLGALQESMAKRER